MDLRFSQQGEQPDEQDSSPEALVFWGCIRAIFLAVALFFASGGIVFLDAFLQDGAWGMFVGGILFLLGGSWLVWTSIFGRRTLIVRVFIEFLANVVGRLF